MEIALNYRHAFHAGNFADLVKHAILLGVLTRLTREETPLEVIDTHAGAGLYDLHGEAAKASGEADAGIGRLLRDANAPAVFDPLKAAVRAANPGGDLGLYPGSPALILGVLRLGDRYTGCELQADDCAALCKLVQAAARAKGVQAEALRTDGYALASRAPERPEPRSLILIDPPFERGDDYRRIVETLAGSLKARRRAIHAVWTPLKDLETFDHLLRELETLPLPQALVVQTRLRPLRDPMRMNGCAMIITGLPEIETEARAVCGWVAHHLGEPGGEGRVERLSA